MSTIALAGGDQQYLAWCRKVKMNGNSDTTKQLYENRSSTVQAYVAKFRSGAIKGVLPAEAAQMTVEAALQAGEVGGVNVCKLLQDNREKFGK